VPRLQRPENLWWFFTQHRGWPVPSPQLLRRLTDEFVGSIDSFAERHRIPLVRFEGGERKEDVARKYLARFNDDEGVVMIGVAREMVPGFRVVQKGPRKQPRKPRSGAPRFSFYRGQVHVNQYYFYVLDRHFGLAFIKFSSYAPFGIRVWVNGHEWAKRQIRRKGVRYQELDNGFFSQVFDRPLHGREFFEEVIRDNLDVGRPDRVQLLFERRISKQTPGRFRTRVLTDGVQPSLRFDYKHTRVKQYFKLNRARRTETTFSATCRASRRSAGTSTIAY